MLIASRLRVESGGSKAKSLSTLSGTVQTIFRALNASPVKVRPSYFAFKYLAERGYDMIPVNPGHVGKSLVGKPFVASLKDIDRPIDMIDIFRNSSHIMPVVD